MENEHQNTFLNHSCLLNKPDTCTLAIIMCIKFGDYHARRVALI